MLGDNLGKIMLKIYEIILDFIILIRRTSQYGGVPYHLNYVWLYIHPYFKSCVTLMQQHLTLPHWMSTSIVLRRFGHLKEPSPGIAAQNPHPEQSPGHPRAGGWGLACIPLKKSD